MKAIEYLLSSLLASEDDSVAISTIFDLIKESDVPAGYKDLFICIKKTWKEYGLIEPVAVFMIIGGYSKDYNKVKRLRLQLNTLFGLVVTNAFWKHYLQLTLIDIKADKTSMLVRKNAAIKPQMVDAQIAEIKKEINEISEQYQLIKRRSIMDSCTDFLANLDDLKINKNKNRILVGLDFERFTRGFHPSDYIILAARPKMGKSAVANAIVVRALRQGKRVMLVNNEMDEMLVMNRLIANLAEVKIDKIQEPENLTDEEMEIVSKAADKLSNLPLNLYCLKFKNASDIKAEALRLKDEGTPVDLIVIDYLQLLFPTDMPKTASKYEQVSTLSWEIKMLANDLKTPVLAISQLNRALEQRSDKRPVPADLRDSGALEQDATAVMFLYRDECYNKDTDDVGIGELNVAINRNGKSGMVKMFMDFDFMDVKNLDFPSC